MNKLTSDRKFWPTLLLTIVTLGFYQWYLIYAFAKETNIACKEDGKKTPGLTIYVLLSIITLGIYAIVWRCMWIKRCNSYLKQKGKPEGLQISTYLLMVLGYPLLYFITSYTFAAIISLDMMNQNSSLFLIARIIASALLIIWLICWIIIIYKQLYLQNAVNSTYNKIKAHSKKEWLNDYLQNAVKNTRNDSIVETYDNLTETQSTKEPASINNKIQPSIPPSVKHYRTIATIFTALVILASLTLQYGYYVELSDEWYGPLIIAKILFFIPILLSLLKISANKATQNAVIIIFSTTIFKQLSFLFNFIPFEVEYWILEFIPILYYLSISYAVSIILRNNQFEKDTIKKTWITLFPLLWICPQTGFLQYFSVVLIPACFYAIHSSVFGGPTTEEKLTAKPYAAINRYTIASTIVCILTYLIQIYDIIENYKFLASFYM